MPFALAASMGLPVIDADGMGRAFPELQMVTYYLDGVAATPMVLADEKGNHALLNTVDNVWTERIARSATTEMGGSVMVSIYPMDGETVKKSGIPNTLQLEEDIGRVIREAKQHHRNPIKEVLKQTGGFKLFQGKVTDINRKTETGFARGMATIEGLESDQGDELYLRFQNEHLVAETNEQVLCMTPDLIAVLDSETAMPITTEGMRYGNRCMVIGIPSNEKWRTEKGIEAVGPRYFGYDFHFTPVEQLIESKEEV